MVRRTLALLMLPALLLPAACADPNAPSRPGGPGGYQPDDVVLRVESEGGFVPAAYLITRLPEVSIYGDGRVIRPGAVPAIYPGPAVQPLGVRTIDTADLATLVQLALDAGVGSAGDLGTPGVADVPDTVLTVLTADGVKETRVYALGFDDASGLTQAQRDARAKLSALVEKLHDLEGTLSAAKVGPEELYTPAAMAVIARPWVDTAEPELGPRTPKAWPGPALPGPALPNSPLEGVTCLSLFGAEVTAALQAASEADALTPWEWDGKTYSILFRPLLPDEPSCTALTR